MESSFFFFALVLLLPLCSIIKPSSSTTPLPNSTTDQNALIALKNSITSDPNGMLAKNWSSNTSFCHWIGISCGLKHPRVTALNISGFGLRGTLPPHLGNLTFLRYIDISSNNFTGPIPPEMSRLYRLQEIDMGVNSFSGEIPSWFGALAQLENLRLDNNSFSGSIPEEIGNCSSLQILNLNVNRLTGSIPYGVFNLSSIRQIRIMYNGISGRLPIDMCNNLPNLTRLSLSDNQIEGPIPPNVWKCRELEILSLSYNRFNGEIPSAIGSLSMLKYLYLGFNNFKGEVPAELGNLSQLLLLNIASASLTGPVPKEIGNCTSLNALDLHDNQLTGPIPKQIGNCTSLKIFYLRDNYLTGELPQELASLAFIETFNVYNNSLSGPIPSFIFNISTSKILGLSYNLFSGNLHVPSKFSLSNLEELYLGNNRLSGEIPRSIANASKLTMFSLSNNSFSGSLPNFGSLRLLQHLLIWNNNLTVAEFPNEELGFIHSLTNCQYLVDIDISGNPLNIILPTSIGNLSTFLRRFAAQECNIKGVVPSMIGNLSNLQYLNLEGNQLTGFIPQEIGKLKQIQVLYLGWNRLSGYIPPDLCQLDNTGDLSLRNNILTGQIPECLGEVMSLRNIYFGSNKLNSTIPSGFWNLRDLLFLDLSSNYLSGQLSDQIANLKAIYQLDLSRNQLSGDIPNSIDGCQSLEFLSLSNNKFEGSIPPSLGNMRGLSTLDLSSNNFSGSIPESLEGLNLLQYFNVSCNKLEGEIPTGGQFSNFTAQSFLNNSALCGAPKFQVPPCIEKDIRTSRLHKASRLMKYILPPFILVIVATAIVFVLLRKRKLKGVPETAHSSLGTDAWRRISYSELQRGTNAFGESNLLGIGGFGSVFKATLSDGLNVAVKVFNLQLERAIRSFDTECEILGNIRHRNLVRIIGCCSNMEFKALILGYMPNGSLEKWLYSENYCLDLVQTLHIAIDIASALEYLHHGHTFPIVHCDIKPSNVLLDEDMVAHLSDFGISKLFDDGETVVQTKTLATIGYTAPEYGSEGKVSTNGDVYSYGILLLEVFTRKRPTDDMFSEEMSLKDWVNKALQENAVSEVLALDLLAREDEHFFAKLEGCVSSIFNLAMKCLAVSPDERINMIETVAALKRIETKVAAGTKRSQKTAFSITVEQ